MTRSFVDGIAHIRDLAARRVDIGVGNCKLRTREAFGVPSNGTATAAASWQHAPDKHAGGRPEDAPALSFGYATGGGSGAGHVWVNIDGKGRILTPGGPDHPSLWYETTVGALLGGWRNLRYAGWTRTIDGQAPALPAPPAKAAPLPPTRVSRARALLRAALAAAKRKGNAKRAGRIADALDNAPER
ncbi:hypothetical protein JCM18899A_18900 [Nocardioides sp. AN3]